MRPSAERGRTSTVESRGSGSTRFSSFMLITAVSMPFEWCTGLISDTLPTRSPPIRTSLPTTRLAAFGSSAFTLYVGTNGSPLFAL